MPCILCGPATPVESTAEAAGSTATIFTSGFLDLRNSPTPVRVPPVPTPATKISTLPSVSSHISGPVVFLCASGFAGFANWEGIKLFGYSFASSSAFAIAPFMPFAPSVSTSSAPYAFISCLRSTDIVSGITMIILYPLAAATAASPMPVLPEVGSMMTESGVSFPLFSASSIIAFAILSLTEPAGLKYSSFASSVALSPCSFSICVSSRSGVLPIS